MNKECRQCNGSGGIFAFMDGHDEDGEPLCHRGIIRCDMCRGTGTIPDNMRIVPRKVGAAVREERRALNWDLVRLAKSFSCTVPEASSVERGKAVPEKVYREALAFIKQRRTMRGAG